MGIATAHRYKAWCYHLPLQEDDTQQRRLAEFSKNPINQEFSGGKSLNVISQRRRLHVPHWSMSEFRGLRDCVTGLPRLDRDSYWVHSSLGSDKGLRASDESDNGSCPWLCPVVFGFAKGAEGGEEKYERRHLTTAETISAHWIQLALKGIRLGDESNS